MSSVLCDSMSLQLKEAFTAIKAQRDSLDRQAWLLAMFAGALGEEEIRFPKTSVLTEDRMQLAAVPGSISSSAIILSQVREDDMKMIVEKLGKRLKIKFYQGEHGVYAADWPITDSTIAITGNEQRLTIQIVIKPYTP